MGRGVGGRMGNGNEIVNGFYRFLLILAINGFIYFYLSWNVIFHFMHFWHDLAIPSGRILPFRRCMGLMLFEFSACFECSADS